MFKQILKQKLFCFSRRHKADRDGDGLSQAMETSCADRRSHTNQFNDALAQFQFVSDFEFWFPRSSPSYVHLGLSFNARESESESRIERVVDLSSALQRRLGLPVVASLLSIIISIRNEAKATKTKLIFSSFRCRRILKEKRVKKSPRHTMHWRGLVSRLLRSAVDHLTTCDNSPCSECNVVFDYVYISSRRSLRTI